MKYQCGIYGGSFNPLHQGHVACILRAACLCRRLIVIISSGKNRGEVDARVRYRWIYQLTKHLGNVDIFILEDDAPTKAEYTEELWLADAQKVKDYAAQPIDAVFCGSDYGADSIWARCYPQAEIVVFERSGISSTALRADLCGNWDSLADVAKPYYVRKVLLIGCESTGKSTLTINLAHYYNTNYLEEVGREISARSGTDMLMLPEDFTDILLAHKLKEREAVQHSRMVLFEDTDCLITRFFIDFLEGEDRERNATLADAIAGLNNYDLVLFLMPDVEFVQDGDRSEVIAADREKYSRQIQQLYSSRGFEFEVIGGDYLERFEQAVKLVDRMLGIEQGGNENA